MHEMKHNLINHYNLFMQIYISEKSLNVKNLIDTCEWLSKLKLLQKAVENDKVAFHCNFNNKLFINSE